MVAARMGECQQAVAPDDEITASLQSVFLHADRPALYAPLDILPDDSRAIDSPDGVASQTVGVVDHALWIGQEACPLEHVIWHGQTALLVGWREEPATKVGYPVPQALQVGEREHQHMRIERCQLIQGFGQVHLHEMLIAVESAQVTQEDEGDRLGKLGKVYCAAIGRKECEIGSGRSNWG